VEMSEQEPTEFPWQEVEQWWVDLAQRLGVGERVREFFKNALGHEGALERVRRVGGNVHYLLFVVLRYWIPAVLPPAGRERLTKNDPDYWLESEQILRAAVVRLRQLKPLIELLTAPNPLAQESTSTTSTTKPVVEVELTRMLEGIAEVAGSYGGPDYTSVIKHFDPIPLRQTQPFKHNKKNSAELWVVFLLREHFRALGLGKDRYWPLIAEVSTAAGIVQQTGQPHSPDDLKSWWQKNWPRTYTQVEQHTANPQSAAIAYHQDFEWFRGWWEWQMSRPSTGC
jgi:hypothetical protein